MSTKRTAAETSRALRKKLIRLAHNNPEKRAAIFPVLRKMGVKLPDGQTKQAAVKARLTEKLTRLAADESDPEKQAAAATMLDKLAKGEKMPKDLLDKFKGKDKKAEAEADDEGSDKEAAVKVAINKDTEDFVRWVVSTRSPMSPSEVESFVNRGLNIKTRSPITKRTGPRYQRGDSVIINAKKHKSRKFDRGNYDRFNGKVGTVVELDGALDVMVAIKGEPAPVRFPGAQSPRGVGIYKYTKPYTVTGSAKVEMIYDAGGKATKDQKVVVDAYLGRARGTEKRAANYYTGHVTLASTGKRGWYFKAFPQQRMQIDPQSEGGYQGRTFNPSFGKVLYIGVFGSRPGNWKDELKSLDEAAAEDDASG